MTDAEWEYACRAGTRTPFYFGETLTPEIANYDGHYSYGLASKSLLRSQTIPVGHLGVANAFGLFDMHGNVWEWCLDVFHPSYKGAPADGSAWERPPGNTRVIRGGSWDNGGLNCRSAARNAASPVTRIVGRLGFRVAVAAVGGFPRPSQNQRSEIRISDGLRGLWLRSPHTPPTRQ